jgi:hypothetical protein
MAKLLQRPLVVAICHDAGGAEIVSAYIRAHRTQYRFFALVAGPAMKIFRRKHIAATVFEDQSFHDFFVAHPDVRFVLAGTGASGMEARAIATARVHHVHTVAFLDHWVNYRERFRYPEAGWEAHLPDEIWVGDRSGYVLAKEFFPQTSVRLLPNPYFREVRASYGHAYARAPYHDAVLFMSEPVPYGEVQILNELLHFFATRLSGATFIIRFHPTESRHKYDALIRKYCRRLHIVKSRHSFIVDDLARARFVIGMESVALVASVVCRKKTISIISDPARPLRLPFAQIHLMREAKEAEILKTYLPAQMPDAELKAIIQAAIREAGVSGPQGMGAVMKAVLPKVAGRADGKRVSEMVAQLLKWV